MTAQDDANYRLRLAKGFLKEAKQDFELKRWRSCVDNAQLAVENSGKTILACYGPTPRTHDPGKELQKLIDKNKIHERLVNELKSVLPFFEELGFEEHFKTDYGLESEYLGPWELYDAADAEKALQAAEHCLNFTDKFYKYHFKK